MPAEAEPEYENNYKCERCGCRWNLTADSMCDDRCPECDLAMSPLRSWEIFPPSESVDKSAPPHMSEAQILTFARAAQQGLLAFLVAGGSFHSTAPIIASELRAFLRNTDQTTNSFGG